MTDMHIIEQVAHVIRCEMPDGSGLQYFAQDEMAMNAACAAIAAVFDWLADPSLAAQEAGKVHTVQGDDWCGVYAAMLAQMRKEAMGE